MSTKNQSKKYLSVVTYCIALICLLLGFFLPVFNGKGLLFMTLPDAFCTTFGISDPNLGDALSREHVIYFFGATKGFDMMALVVTLYGLITAVGVIMLIPVLAAKSNKKTANACAYFVEVVAAVILLIYLIVFVHRLLGVLKNVNGTLKTVDQDLQKLEKPLQTVNELSETVDLVHEASRNAVRSALVTIIENASSIKDWIFSKKKEESQTEGIVAEEDVHEQK